MISRNTCDRAGRPAPRRSEERERLSMKKRRTKSTSPRIAVPPSGPAASIQVRGARVHNLKNLDIDIPRDQLVVLTGVSGSGKSSLAFDTIVAEGQRRYLECVSSYARQYLEQLEPPDVDSVESLPPTVALDQRAGLANPRSTLGTVTEIYDYLRLLFARAGTPHCPSCGTPIKRQTPDQMVSHLMRLKEGQRIQLLAPLVRARKGQHAEVFQAIRRAGLIRARVDGEMIELGNTPPKLPKARTHSVEAVVDRIALRPGIRPRLAESVALALKLSGGTLLVLVESPEGWRELILSVHYSCEHCGTNLTEIEPRSFSFNTPYGACPSCEGLGSRWVFRADLVIPEAERSLAEGAVVPWRLITSEGNPAGLDNRVLADFLVRHQLDAKAPLSSWPEPARARLWEGDPSEAFPGLATLLEQFYRNTRSEGLKNSLAAYREEEPCASCGGSRLRAEARAVRLGGQSIAALTACPLAEAIEFLRALALEPPLDAIAGPLVGEIRNRLQFLADVGLGYLSLGRGSDTLSGGELQRARLAAQLGSGLVGVCTVLDEPTTGLHAHDTARLIGSLRRLVDQGGTVLVVEHDLDVIRAADWVIDLGPGAGPDGGRIVAAAPPDQLSPDAGSITAPYLKRGIALSTDPSPRLKRARNFIVVRGASVHNLKAIEARLPLGALTCVTGVSGSGKSTLVHDVLAPAVRRFLHRGVECAALTAQFEGLDALERLIEVDQSPIGRSPRSTPGTAAGVFDEIRKVFALLRESKIRGFRARRFSFNSEEGRCEACLGVGVRRIPMHFLPDLHVTCEACGGKRFNRQTLEVRFKGKSIGEILEMRADESRAFFSSVPKVLAGLDALHDVGLGYITLGQSSTTLSGGEAQRVKLAAELGKTAGGRALYLLDEPTTGLHFADIDRLLAILHRLADNGHAVIVIEHHLNVVAAADWVVDLGPDAGESGGRVVAMGPPIEIARNPASRTGKALREGCPDWPKPKPRSR
jgi:excinuclease ABC subunit A